MRLSGRAFLGQVPLRVSRFFALGQNAPVTVIRRLPESNPDIPFENFDPTLTREQLDRRQAGAPRLAQKKAECAAANENNELAKEAYYAAEEAAKDAALAEWGKAADAADACNKELTDIINYIDFGGTVPWSTPWEWPKEIPEPESYQFPPPTTTQSPPQPPPVASVHEPVQQPIEQPVQQPVQPPEVPQAPSVATTDWRFEGCPAGHQRIVRGGACVPAGLLSAGLNMPGTTTTPMMTTTALQGRIRVAPLYRGRF